MELSFPAGHGEAVPRTTLRHAIGKLAPDLRRRYLATGRGGRTG